MRPHLARVERAHPFRMTPADAQVGDVLPGEAALEDGRVQGASPAPLEDAGPGQADGLRPAGAQGMADAHEKRVRGRDVRAARLQGEVGLAVDGDGALDM